MRVLFSSMRLIGHIRPLLPYAHALLNRGHDVLVTAPDSAGAILREAGLAHAAFGHPGDERLSKIWATFPNMSPSEILDTVVGKIFADLNARAALPGLRETIRTWKPDIIVRNSANLPPSLRVPRKAFPLPGLRRATATRRLLAGFAPSRLLTCCVRRPVWKRTTGLLCAPSPPSHRFLPRSTAMPPWPSCRLRSEYERRERPWTRTAPSPHGRWRWPPPGLHHVWHVGRRFGEEPRPFSIRHRGRRHFARPRAAVDGGRNGSCVTGSGSR